MKSYKFALVFYFTLVSLTVFAQRKKAEMHDVDYLDQPHRIEFDYKYENGEYYIVPADGMGLVVLRETSKRENGQIWEFNYMDTLLEKKWTKKYALPTNFAYTGYDYSNGFVNLLYTESNKRDVREFTLLRLELTSGDTTQFKLETVFPIVLSEFEVLDEVAILGGYANYRPVIALYDFKERKMKVLPGFYNNRSELLDVELDDEKLRFNALLTETTPGKRQTVSIKTFSEEGEVLQNRILEPDEDKSLLYGQSTRLNYGTQYITGTYAARKSNYSRGVYMAKIDKGKQEYLKYYSFSELSNFFSYLPSKRQERVEERVKRKQIEGKKVKLSYRLLVHDIVKLEDNYIMIGEAYYPKQSSVSYGGLPGGRYGSNGRFYDNGRYSNNRGFNSGGYYNNSYNSMIDGYKYTHAVVIAFDEDGDVIWDNSFEISDVLSPELKQFVHVAGKKDEVLLLYTFEGEIMSKLVIGDDISEGKTISAIKLKNEDDELIRDREDEGGLAKWNQNSFYAYGIQRIKQADGKRREVFYVNKIVYK